MRPTVTLQQAISLDGRLTGFPVDAGLYYDLAARIPHDAVLSGTGTLLAAAREHGVDLDGYDDRLPEPDGDGPLLVVPDSRARLTRFAWLREQPFWRDVVILAGHATPRPHLDRLRELGLGVVVAGDDHVDLATALEHLRESYAVRAVRVDAGPTLAGVLLAAGLVDELDLVLTPYLAEPPVALELRSADQERDGRLHLRYAVTGRTGAAAVG